MRLVSFSETLGPMQRLCQIWFLYLSQSEQFGQKLGLICSTKWRNWSYQIQYSCFDFLTAPDHRCHLWDHDVFQTDTQKVASSLTLFVLQVLHSSDYLQWLLSVTWLFVLELMRSRSLLHLNSNEQWGMLHTSRKGIYLQNTFLQAHQTVTIFSTAKVSNWHFFVVHLLHLVLQIWFKDLNTSWTLCL